LCKDIFDLLGQLKVFAACWFVEEFDEPSFADIGKAIDFFVSVTSGTLSALLESIFQNAFLRLNKPVEGVRSLFKNTGAGDCDELRRDSL
jgi:hypothetical protein